MSGIGIKTRGSNSSSLFSRGKTIYSFEFYVFMSTNLWFVCTVWLIQTDDYMFQARMFSGVMTGNLCIRVCDEFCFCCVLLIFSEGGIFRMDDDSSIMNCSKRVVDKRRWGWFVLWLTTPSQPVIHPNYYMYNVCFRNYIILLPYSRNMNQNESRPLKAAVLFRVARLIAVLMTRASSRLSRNCRPVACALASVPRLPAISGGRSRS